MTTGYVASASIRKPVPYDGTRMSNDTALFTIVIAHNSQSHSSELFSLIQVPMARKSSFPYPLCTEKVPVVHPWVINLITLVFTPDFLSGNFVRPLSHKATFRGNLEATWNITSPRKGEVLRYHCFDQEIVWIWYDSGVVCCEIAWNRLLVNFPVWQGPYEGSESMRACVSHTRVCWRLLGWL